MKNNVNHRDGTDAGTIPTVSVVGAVVPSKQALQRGIELMDIREELYGKLRGVEEELLQLLSGAQVANLAGEMVTERQNQSKKGRRGKMKIAIENALKTAGRKGIHIKDLAKRLNTDVKNVSSWFALTGKNNPGIKRIARGTYRFNRSAAKVAASK